jgi:threonine/homoserine/homoserine lactone efflux protein
MGLGLLLAFAGFAFVSSITPGPNNVMLLASGVNYGFRRTVPHIAGISLGCVAMVLLVGLGLEQVFAAVPQLYDVLRYTGAAYLLWLAWKIARAGPVVEGPSGGRPMTFCQAAAFQWINPKAWVIVVGAVGTYAPRDGFGHNVIALAVLLGAIMVPSISGIM